MIKEPAQVCHSGGSRNPVAVEDAGFRLSPERRSISSSRAGRAGYVTFNGGSSSVKFALFAEQGDDLVLMSHGEIERIDTQPHFIAKNARGETLADRQMDSRSSYDDLLGELIAWVEVHLAPARLTAVGHRVVHGGSFFAGPVKVDDDVMAKLESLSPLAPLHQPHNLAAIRAIARLHSDLPQIACFDTSFHLTNSRISRMYALPRALTEAGVMRYGFHGLSYEHIARELPKHEPRASGRVIGAHLGSGASLCAMVGGKSIATTMGFSALDGLPMATRCGNLDPGVLLYLMQERKMDAQAIECMLYRESGLLGVSGISGDMRELLASDEPAARDAVDLFVYRIAREIGSLAAAMNGFDVLVFTGGIGQNAAAIRARICEAGRWLGVALDPVANTAGGPLIHGNGSRVSIWVLPAGEERVIAGYSRLLVQH